MTTDELKCLMTSYRYIDHWEKEICAKVGGRCGAALAGRKP